MRIGRIGHDYRVFTLLLAMCCAVTGTSYFMLSASVDRMVEKDAEDIAAAWGRNLGSRWVQMASENAEGRLGFVTIQTLYDEAGRPFLQADEKGVLRNVALLNSQAPPEVLDALVRGRPIHDGFATRIPDTASYAITIFQPILHEGRKLGVAAFHIDQNAKRALIWRHFQASALAVAAMAALAFTVPALIVLWRAREKQEADAHIRFLVEHDPVTRLYNRNTFVKRIDDLVRSLGDSREAVAIHFLDIDRFKDWNDTLGHDVGDELIREMAVRLRQIAGDERVARVGGDQFILAQPHVTSEHQAFDHAAALINELSRAFTVRGHTISASLSCGIALSPRDGRDAAALITCAELALFSAKAAGGGLARAFTPDMNAQMEERKRLERIVREASQNEAFDLYFQPVMGADHHLAGFEALLRLIGPDGKHIPPNTFIPVAEESGLIHRIGTFVIRRAVQVAAQWPDPLTISVNLSPVQFAQGDLIDIVRNALEESGLPAARLELEITESMLLKDTDNVMEQLRALSQLGVCVAMDDFGIGYSSLSYLWRFPFHKIKIDRSFMQAFEAKDKNIASILKTIIALGRSLSMKVTAEGVETQEQADFLRSLDCDFLQGYHFGRPMPVLEANALILRQMAPAQRPPRRGSGHLSAV